MIDYSLELVDTFKVGDILFSKDRFFGANVIEGEEFPRKIQRFFVANEDDVRDYSDGGRLYYKLVIDKWGNEPNTDNNGPETKN